MRKKVTPLKVFSCVIELWIPPIHILSVQNHAILFLFPLCDDLLLNKIKINPRVILPCGKKMDQIMKDFDRDYWMDAKEAVEYGIVDIIVEKL